MLKSPLPPPPSSSSAYSPAPFARASLAVKVKESPLIHSSSSSCSSSAIARPSSAARNSSSSAHPARSESTLTKSSTTGMAGSSPSARIVGSTRTATGSTPVDRTPSSEPTLSTPRPPVASTPSCMFKTSPGPPSSFPVHSSPSSSFSYSSSYSSVAAKPPPPLRRSANRSSLDVRPVNHRPGFTSPPPRSSSSSSSYSYSTSTLPSSSSSYSASSSSSTSVSDSAVEAATSSTALLSSVDRLRTRPVCDAIPQTNNTSSNQHKHKQKQQQKQQQQQCCINIPSSTSTIQQIELRMLISDDIPAMKVLCRDWFPIEYPDYWYLTITQTPGYVTLASIIDGSIMGLVVAEVKRSTRCNPEDKDILHFLHRRKRNVDVAYILSIGVSDKYRRKGIATFLLDSLLDRLPVSVKAVYLHVMVGNKAAIHLYERSCFNKHRRLPRYYTIKDRYYDAYTYVRALNQPPGSSSSSCSASASATSRVLAATVSLVVKGHGSLVDFVGRLVARLTALEPCMIPQRLIFSFHRILFCSRKKNPITISH